MNTTRKLRFERRYRPPLATLVAAFDAEHLADALRRGMHEAAETPAVTGRGAVYRFRLDEGEGIVRPCRRGGFIRNILHDSYLFSNRPLREFRIHCAAYELGIPVPEPLGVAWYRRGAAFRGALATRYVPMESLSKFASSHPKAAEPAMHRAGALIRQAHDAGLDHADLNAGNILIDDSNAVLIDLDKAVLHGQLPARKRANNLRRLRRSLDKLGHDPAHFTALCQGYAGTSPPPWLTRLCPEAAAGA